MASAVKEATLLDKASFAFPHLAKVLGAVLYRLASYPFVSSKLKSPLKDILFAGLRQNLGDISPTQEQWTIVSSTQDAYLDLAKKQNFQAESTALNSGLRLHWLGPKTAEKVILFFHGGGYVIPCSPGHYKWLFDLQIELSKTKSVSVLIVSYTLAPHGTYPQQLQQAAEALNWLVGKRGMKPSDVIIAGDSAGGNMCLGLISHLLHPHPEATKIELVEPLATAILISPWFTFSTDDASFKRNAKTDMLPPQAAKRWSSLLMGGKATDEYIEPIKADSKWFSGLDRVVEDMLVWGGSAEVLIDSIQKVGKILKDAHPGTEVVVQKGAAHDDFIVEAVLGIDKKNEGTKLIETWMTARL